MTSGAAGQPAIGRARRALAAIVFFAGGVLIAMILHAPQRDWQRFAPSAAIALGSIALAGLTAAGVRVTVPRSAWWMGIGMAAILAIATYSASVFHTRVTLSGDAPAGVALRQRIADVVAGQRLLAMTSGYAVVALSIALAVRQNRAAPASSPVAPSG